MKYSKALGWGLHEIAYTFSLLKNILSDTEVKRILNEGVEYTRYLKSWLSIHTFLVVPNPVVDFGEFTIKLRFYRQIETNSIAIEVID